MGLTHPCRRTVRLLAGLGLAVLVLTASGTAAPPRSSEDVVKIRATADKPDAEGNQLVTLTLDISKPWHLYANPVGNEDIADAATVVTVSGKTRPQAVKIDYPAGTDHQLGDIKFKIYEGQTTIKAHVRRARGDTGPLEVSVKLQACDKATCLQPSTVKVTVP
jgi:DsbC/DsbD-like thiol-disulfide interchange protein